MLLLKETKLNEKVFQTKVVFIDDRLRELKNQIDDLSNNLKSTDNYLEKYQPFNSFCLLFEILRMALEPESLGKIKDYEEYRLKELYDIILQDEGNPKTSFNKKHIVKPVSYNFDELSDTTSLPKLQAKSRRVIMDRPSITSAIRVNDSGAFSKS